MASTGIPTANYDLNQWLGTDKPERLDFNSDNQKTDAALNALDASLSTLDAQYAHLAQEMDDHKTDIGNPHSILAQLAPAASGQLLTADETGQPIGTGIKTLTNVKDSPFSNPNDLGGYTGSYPHNVNANMITEPGFYYRTGGNNGPNFPPNGLSTSWSMFVEYTGRGDVGIKQTVTGYASGRTFIRMLSDIGNWTPWQELNTTPASGLFAPTWTTLPLTNGATQSPYPTMRLSYCKVNGIVTLSGEFIPNTLSVINLATMPVGYRSKRVHIFISANQDASTKGRAGTIRNDGTVTVVNDTDPVGLMTHRHGFTISYPAEE